MANAQEVLQEPVGQAQIQPDDPEDEFTVDVSGLLDHIVWLEVRLWEKECELDNLIALLSLVCENLLRLNRQNILLEELVNVPQSTPGVPWDTILADYPP